MIDQISNEYDLKARYVMLSHELVSEMHVTLSHEPVSVPCAEGRKVHPQK